MGSGGVGWLLSSGRGGGGRIEVRVAVHSESRHEGVEPEVLCRVEGLKRRCREVFGGMKE